MKKILVVFILWLLMLITSATAYAYFDPGTGSMLLQIAAASALSLGLFWRQIIHFIKKVFGGKK